MMLITGGAGFIGGNFVLGTIGMKSSSLINLDQLTYAGNLQTLQSIFQKQNYYFYRGDIGDRLLVSELLKKYKPRAVINFAAESHVDRSIHGPESFIKTNIVGTFNLLESVRDFYEKLDDSQRNNFRFLHVSTDEVYGTLDQTDPPFTETNPYEPNSPYAASKAASNH